MSKQFNNQPLVSVVMNCYNGEAYLYESIKSILSQTYENWELIFWDNQSTDSSAEIFKSYRDKRFRYFYANGHTPLYKARNLAIEKSKGDFIAFLDTDDLWSKEKLKLQMFEQDIVKKSKSKISKASIRKASTPIEAIVAYKKFIKK